MMVFQDVVTVLCYLMKLEKQVRETFEEYICKVGEPIGLKCDNAKLELHGCTKDILCLCSIDVAQSDQHCQHQNQAERKTQDVKRAGASGIVSRIKFFFV